MAIEILTFALVVITGFYAWVTFRMLQVSAEQAEATNRPYVAVSIVSSHSSVFNLRIANRGRTVANDLRLELDRDFFQWGRPEGNLRALSAFKDPIQGLPPGSELSFQLTSGVHLLGPQADPKLTPAIFKVTATYSFFGRTVTEETTIDANPYRGSQAVDLTVIDALTSISAQLKIANNKT